MKLFTIMKLAFLIVIINFIFSDLIGQSNSNFYSNQYGSIRKNTVETTWKLPSKNQIETFEILGLEYFGDCTIKVKTKNTHYIIFLAATNISKKDSSLPRIISFKNLNSCFLYREDPNYSDTTYYETINHKLIFDKKMAKIYNNDSIYISHNGIDYETVPNIIGELSGNIVLDAKTRTYSDHEIIPLFSGYFKNYEEVERIRKINEENNSFLATGLNQFMIGILFYDCKKDEIGKILESPIFANFVNNTTVFKTTKEDCIKFNNDIKGYYQSKF